MPRIPFARQSYQARSLDISAQRLVNVYPELNQPDSTDPYTLYTVPGLKLFSSLDSGPVRGRHVMAGILYAVSRNTLYSVTGAGTPTPLGAIPGSGQVSMADNGTQLVIVNGDGFVYTVAAGLQSITDPDFPGASTVTYQGGYFIFSRPGTGQFLLSALFDGLDYDALDFATAEAHPDDALAVVSDHNELWVFGERTIEINFQTDAIFPFSRQALIEMGCASRHSIVRLDNTLWWQGTDFAIYRAAGTIPQKMSSLAMDEQIRKYANKQAVGFCYALAGHNVVIWRFEEGCWLFDLNSALWYERNSYQSDTWKVGTGQKDITLAYNKVIVGGIDGNLYELDLDTFDEDGEVLRQSFTFAPLGDGRTDFAVNEFHLEAERGVGLTNGQGSDPQVMLDWSDDGGRTWGNEVWRSIGPIGNTQDTLWWNQLGSSRRRIFRGAISDPVKIAAYGADADIDV